MVAHRRGASRCGDSLGGKSFQRKASRRCSAFLYQTAAAGSGVN